MRRRRGVMRVTLKDIATRAGYTANTVSRALKDKEDIGRRRASRSRRSPERWATSPISVAASLRTGQTSTIAVVLGDISNPTSPSSPGDRTKRAQTHYSTIILNRMRTQRSNPRRCTRL